MITAHPPAIPSRRSTPLAGDAYAGNHKYHAAKPDGSDHLRCTITGMTDSGPTALCSGQIAIGGSMLLANRLITPKNIGNNTDFTIRVTYRPS